MNNNQKIFFSIALIAVVGIAGYSALTNKFNQSKVFPVWETYTNTKYGYQFQYPSSWKIGENSKSVSVSPPQEVGRNDYFDVLVEDKTLQSIEKEYDTAINNGSVKIKSDIVVDGIKAIKYSYAPEVSNDSDIFLSFKGTTYHIYTWDPFQTQVSESSQILSTFQFTDAVIDKSLNFISPAKGDVWQIGEPHQIVFSPLPYESHCSNVIYLINSNNKEVGVFNTPFLEKDQTSTLWEGGAGTVSCGTSSEAVTINPGIYRLRLDENDTVGSGEYKGVYSDFFTLK